MSHTILMGWIFITAGLLRVDPGTPGQKYYSEAYRSESAEYISIKIVGEKTLPKDVYFQVPSDMSCDLSGFVYVCDMRSGHVLKFDSDGNYILTIGRKGAGPGEFIMPMLIAVSGNRLFVYDAQNRRLCAFTLDGDYLNSIKMDAAEGRIDKMRGLKDGSVILGRERIHYEDKDKPQEYSLVRLSADLKSRHTIYRRDIWRIRLTQVGNMLTNVIQPFSPLVSWEVTTDEKIIIGNQKSYEIEIYNQDGGKEGSFQHEYEAVKINEKDKEKYFDNMSFSSSRNGEIVALEKCVSDSIIRATTFPKEKPAFFGILKDAEGNFLISPYRKNREEDGKVFDVFTSSGRYVRTIKIKIPNMNILKGAPWEGGLWAFAESEEGLPLLVKFRIVKAKSNLNGTGIGDLILIMSLNRR